jgi:hypothetical protein
VVLYNNKYGFINSVGKQITPHKYSATKVLNDTLYAVAIGGSMERIRGSGAFSPLRLVGGKWGLLNCIGKEITLLKYDEIQNFTEGLAPVRLNKKCGFLDTTGKESIALKFDEVKSFSNGKALVQKEGKTFYINYLGVKVE